MAEAMYDQNFNASNGFDGDAHMLDGGASYDKKVKGDESLDFQQIDSYDGGPITEEDSWTVIAAHFQERGLVGQQLDSFDCFLTTTMQVRYLVSLSYCPFMRISIRQ